MQTYELTLVLAEKSTVQKTKKVGDYVTKTTTTMKGTVSDIQDWGKIKLHSPIKKNKSGVFMHFVLELNGKSAKNLSDKLRLESDVLRYLLVKKGWKK